MAGRFVVLEFEDRDAANAFVNMDNIQSQLHFTPVAMFLKPRKFCECPEKKRIENKNWKKHPKYGLYICTVCGKPSRFHNRGILERLQYAFGYSILGKS